MLLLKVKERLAISTGIKNNNFGEYPALADNSGECRCSPPLTLKHIKMSSYTKYIQPAIIAGLLIALIVSWKKCNTQAGKVKEATQLIEALGDTVTHYKKKDSTNVAQIQVITTESTKAFTDLKNLNDDVKELQKLVKEYQKSLKPGSSVTRAVIETKVTDTGKTKITK